MKKLITTALCAIPLAFLPPAFAQGVNGPSGSGAMGASDQAATTHPDALSGNSAAVHGETQSKKPDAPAGNSTLQPKATKDANRTVSPSANRSASGGSKSDADAQGSEASGAVTKSSATPMHKSE